MLSWYSLEEKKGGKENDEAKNETYVVSSLGSDCNVTTRVMSSFVLSDSDSEIEAVVILVESSTSESESVSPLKFESEWRQILDDAK